jgi:hypothetical protein
MGASRLSLVPAVSLLCFVETAAAQTRCVNGPAAYFSGEDSLEGTDSSSITARCNSTTDRNNSA